MKFLSLSSGHYWKDGRKTWNWSKTTLMDEESSPVDRDQRRRDNIPFSRGGGPI